MTIDSRFLIFGNAVLFTALGCEPADEGDPTPDAELMARDGRIEPDLAPEADMSPEGDMRLEVDMAWQVDMAPEADVSVEPDAAGPELDMNVEADMWVALDEGVDPDMSLEPDMQWLPDIAPPDPDMALVPDAQQVPDMAPPLGCADLIGEGCMVADEGCCPDGRTPEAVCWGDGNGRMVWQSIPGDFFCNCFQAPDQTSYTVACAVPGFVGVERAGRRLDGPRLRDLLVG